MRTAFPFLLILLVAGLHAQTPKAPEKKPVELKKLEDITKWGKANEAYKAGVEAFSKGKGDVALDKFTEALTAIENFTDARFARGRTHYEMKHFSSAAEDFTRVIAEKAEMTDAIYYRGLALWNLDKKAEALTDFDTVVKKDTRNFAYREKRALLRQDLKQYAAAREDLDIMVALEPLSPATLEHRARVHALMGEKQLADQDEQWAAQLREAGF